MSHTEHKVFALKDISSETDTSKTMEYQGTVYEIFMEATDTIGLYTELKDQEKTDDLVFVKAHVYAGTKKNVDEEIAGDLASSPTPFLEITEYNMRKALAEARQNVKSIVS